MLEENKAKGSTEKKEEGTVKKKKLAVVFHSQNSVNHKNHPLSGKFSDKAKKVKESKEAEKKDEEKKSPNGRPLPPGTARVTPLKALNAIQKKQAEEEKKLEEERILKEAKEREEAAKREAEEAAKKAREAKAETGDTVDKPRTNKLSGIVAHVVSKEGKERSSSREKTEGRAPSFPKGDRKPGFNKDFGKDGEKRGGFSKDSERKPFDGRGKAPAGRKPAAESFAPEIVEKQSRVKHDAVKPAKKTYGNKNFENEKATISQKNRAQRKQNKYGATQSYERDDQIKAKKTGKGAFIKPEVVKAVEETIKSITLPEVITIKELADKMKQKSADIIKKLFLKGQIVTLNTELSYEEAENIAVEYDILCEMEEKVDVIAELVQDSEVDEEKDLEARPPVVAVMGHVDHGKTSILDAIRNTNVTSREHGGITQSIGAYQVSVKVNGDSRVITFLDTPGHEAFTAMRMRGAQSTDIAVLVVAADDGIKPQTIEAINHAKAANTEIIVAINKIDKPTANIDKVKQELMAYDLVAEDYGGSTICCPVSAKTGEGLENLLENIALQADVLELKANPNRKAYGVVIEAELDKGRGSVARLLVQKGTLHIGDVVAVGSAFGKVRAMIDDKGRRIKKATPSMPVEILGLNSVPNAGEIFQVKDNEKEAKAYADTFVSEGKQRMVEESRKKVSLDALFDQIKAGELKDLPIVLKADVQGSVEAVRDSLQKIQNEEVQVKVIHAGVGAINESDINLAIASNAIVIGFDVKPDSTAKDIAERENVDVRLYNIIYKAIEDIELAMKGMLAPVFEEKVIGHAEVRMIFKSSGVGIIAGSFVTDGKVQRGAKARLTRDGEQLFDGNIASVRHFKDDVKEVGTKQECGIVLEAYTDIQEGDQIEVYIMEEVKR